MKHPESSVICAASGMGKTFSILMLARHFASKGRVTVVLANEMLLD